MMDWFNSHWLTTVLFLPAAAAVILQFIPSQARWALKVWTILATLLTTVIAGGLVYNLVNVPTESGPLHFAFSETTPWISSIGANYHLGLDGLAAWMLALNAGTFLVAALVVSRKEFERLKLFLGLLLLSETATAGVILAADLLLFYVFWEAMLIPLYFMLSNFGGEKRGRATLKFVIYTAAGSLAMLVAIIYLRAQVPANAAGFDIEYLISRNLSLGTWPTYLCFFAFVIAFAIKLPLVPFHTWLPDLYEACPPVALVFFAGVVGKLGAFGFIRYVITLFPHASHDFQVLLMVIALISIIYGALMALSETDIKRIVAYSSVSHLGFIALGIFSLQANGINGAILQIVNHGIIIAGLFLVLGMIEERSGTRSRHELAGLEKRMPYLYFFFLIITLAGLGMPGMNSFAGEFTIMLGAFQSSWWWAAGASVGVVLACWYMLRLHQGLMHEPLQPRAEQMRDIGVRDGWILVPLAGLMIFLGVNPSPLGDVASPSTAHYVNIAAPHASASQQGSGGVG